MDIADGDSSMDIAEEIAPDGRTEDRQNESSSASGPSKETVF